jgi:TonB family protein
MKSKTLIPIALIFLACGLFGGSPKNTVQSFLTAAEKGDLDAMNKLFSGKAIEKLGLETIKSNNEAFSESLRKALAERGKYHMESLEENSEASGSSQVSFSYKSADGTGSLRLVFDLSKEGSAWKIDNIGGSLNNKDAVAESASPTESTLVPAPPPPPVSKKSDTEIASPTKPKTISGGILNSKAISLPKPPYPPIAKAVKAQGIVNVQVEIDESGNVVSATAVSGHPLLQASAVAAARSAKFAPTKLSGQAVRVTGMITYKFEPQ